MFIHSHIFHPLWNCIPLYISCILMPLLQLLARITSVIGVLRCSLGKTKCRANITYWSDMNHITTKSLTSGFTTCGNQKLLSMPLSLSVIFNGEKKNKKREWPLHRGVILTPKRDEAKKCQHGTCLGITQRSKCNLAKGNCEFWCYGKYVEILTSFFYEHNVIALERPLPRQFRACRYQDWVVFLLF